MEFAIAVFFLLFYYVRPQDWLPGLAGANLVKPIIGLWLLALVANRSRPSPLPGILRTPHDWIMLTYYGYVVYTAPDAMSTLTGFLPLAAFYALTVQSVNTWERLESYLKWWNTALVIIALFGVLSLVGVDITGAKEATARSADRLCLGTWLHDNPNALGHSVVPVLALSYVLYFWKGTVIGRLFAFPALAAVASWCVLETESKGSFVVGGVLLSLAFIVGRPRIVQILAIVAVLTLGGSALSRLPRMSQMGDLRSDEGVQGRLLAWEVARGVTRRDATGEGWRQFVPLVTWREGDNIIYDLPKSTHSSYVHIGADLGRYGLFLYLAGLWCALHTLLAFRPRNDTEDRCRRVLVILLAGNLVSGWMINRQYHTEYFLLIAAAAALHRLRKAGELAERARQEAEPEPAGETGEAGEKPPEDGLPKPADAPSWLPPPAPAFSSGEPGILGRWKPLWNRFGVLDAGICAGWTWLTFWLWDYILENL